MANKPWQSLIDGIGNGLGYGAILLAVAFFREVFGKGSLLGWKIIGPTAEYAINTSESVMFGWYTNNNLMVLSASAMFVIGIIIWVQRAYNTKLVDIS